MLYQVGLCFGRELNKIITTIRAGFPVKIIEYMLVYQLNITGNMADLYLLTRPGQAKLDFPA